MRNFFRFTYLVLVCALASLHASAASTASLPTTPAGVANASACAALMQHDFSALPEAPTTILSAKFTASADGKPGYCDVEGYVNPNVGFGMRLPADNWNGKYLVHGCGGSCGTVAIAFSCAGLTEQGYACIQTDMGHKSRISDGVWAYNNTPAMIDFGYRATHVSTLAGRAVSQAFYAKPIKRSYYLGCSTGGRQGLVEAQRYPFDFDGIAVNAPVTKQSGAAMQLLWSAQVNIDQHGKQILTAAKLPALAAAVVAACDMNDGVKDGLVGDPRQCHFDPASMICKAADNNSCLTTAQAHVVKEIYAGPHTSDGKALYTGGAPRGSETQWLHAYVLDGTEGPNKLAADNFRYMLFDPAPGPSWKASEFNWDEDYKRVGTRDSLYGAFNPDLRQYKEHGGKLLMMQGWSDINVVPLNAVDYYETATRTMGGPAQTMDFFRLFMVPGAEHCTGGDGAWAVDTLSALDAWVETGKAPEVLIGTKAKPGSVSGGYLQVAMPNVTMTPAFQRPYYPYPTRTVYDGHGDPASASSFKPAP